MATPKLIRERILEALAEHPFLSGRQLELHLALTGRSVRQGLQELAARDWVESFNARQPQLYTRGLFLPTTQGVAELARAAGMPFSDYVRQKALSPTRLERLLVLMERVFQLRTFLQWLANSPPVSRRRSPESAAPKRTAAASAMNGSWQPHAWDVEVARFFSAHDRAFWLAFHGAAVMVKGSVRKVGAREGPANAEAGRWVTVVVEFDLRRGPVAAERERFTNFVLAQQDRRFVGAEGMPLFPILVIIAQDEFRLQEYYTVLQSAASATRLPLPCAYLATVSAMLARRQDRGKPIWYATHSKRYGALLFDVEGVAGPPPAQVPWRKLPLAAPGYREGEPIFPLGRLLSKTETACEDVTEVTPAQKGAHSKRAAASPNRGQADFGRLALTLRPLAKQLLDEIAAHPWLTQPDLALLLQSSRRKVRLRLGELTQLELITRHQDWYLVAPKGEAYLAMVAGCASAVRRSVSVGGSVDGDELLRRHLEHTRAETDFFLHLAAVARSKGHSLRWLSPRASGLYYAAGDRPKYIQPDGRGTYRAGGRRYEFALEIDRSRMSQEKLRRKFAAYAAWLESNVLLAASNEPLRVLVVTSSAERAEKLSRVIATTVPRLCVMLTAFDRVHVSGVDASIWLRAASPQESSKSANSPGYCFDCFESSQPVPRARSP